MVRCLILTILTFCAVSTSHPTSAMDSPSEQELTVAFVFNFLRFTEWPQNTLAHDLTLCVSENTPLEREMAMIAGRQIQNQALAIKRLVWGDGLNVCQALFIGREEKNGRIRDWIKSADGKPILLIGNSSDFLDQGGMIALVLDETRLQFEIDLNPINTTGLRLSGQLLKIAREIRGLADRKTLDSKNDH